jgi:putative ABC transport system permease protein
VVKAGVALSRWRLLNARYFFGHPGRSVLSLSVMAVSAAMIVAVFGIYGSLTGSVARFYGQLAGRADLEVTGVTSTGMEARVVSRIAATRGVAAIAPMVISQITVARHQSILIGADKRAAIMHDLSENRLQQLQARPVEAINGVYLGIALDRHVNAPPGGKVRVDALSGAVHQAYVAGVAAEPGVADVNLGNFIAAPLVTAQRLAGEPGQIQVVYVLAGQGVSISALRQRLTTAVGGSAIVGSTGLQAAEADNSASLLRATTLLVALMALLVAAFLIFNSMSMASAERRSEIATLRVLGGRRRLVTRDFLAEAALTGLGGAVVGSPVGLLLGHLAVGRLPPFLTSSFQVQVGFDSPGYAIPVAVTACVAACLLAAGLPARNLFRVEAMEALRPAELVDGGLETSRWKLATAGGVVFVLGGLVLLAVSGTGVLVSVPLLMLGIILLGYALMAPIASLAARVAGAFGVAGRIGAIAIARSPARAWTTTVVVALGVTISVITIGVGQNAVTATSDSIRSLSLADYYIQTTPADVIPAGPLLPAALIGRVAELPGVTEVSPGQISYAVVAGAQVVLEGFAPGSVAPAYMAASPSARRALIAGHGAVISRLYAKQRHLTVGDPLTLPTPRGNRTLRVAGIVNYVSVNGGLAAIALADLQHWYGQPGATYIEIHARAGANRRVFSALKALVRSLPYQAYLVSGAAEVSAVESSVSQAEALSYLLIWIVAGLTGLSLFNAFMLSVAERRRELGVIRALGANRRLIGRSILAETLAVSLVGGAIGLVTGVLLHVVSTSLISSTGELTVAYHFEPIALALAAAALLLSLAGALPPARYATRLDVIEVIGYE